MPHLCVTWRGSLGSDTGDSAAIRACPKHNRGISAIISFFFVALPLKSKDTFINIYRVECKLDAW